MCQSQSQNPYTRSARTRIIVAVNNMPDLFFVRAPSMCARAKSYWKKYGEAPLRSILTLSPVITPFRLKAGTIPATAILNRMPLLRWDFLRTKSSALRQATRLPIKQVLNDTERNFPLAHDDQIGTQ